ncbi:MAG: murein L,D-transpeptidase catalytic domain family protein [Sphingobacteriales bacterium]|nr:murein L,D-transpeptidase catalytic domain family protein [Sphingobacteriales bacterium]MBI3719563.1 murein L,D-transpeptidase catalytic domain family protein [Sphingobacteriales bacterium]
MRLLLKLLFTILLMVICISLFAWFFWYKPKLNHGKPIAFTKPMVDAAFASVIRDKAEEAKKFIQQKNFNHTLCFLVDMKIESGKNRFFVYDFKRDSIISAGLVTHGSCNESWLNGRKFGNATGCGCTSLGKYKVGSSYNGRFGLAFKLYGLDSSNSNAYNRFVVLHSHSCVPEGEVSPAPICQSLGCPTVSPNYLKHLQKLIDNSNQPILLWIFNE